jgi:hypothetical protein
LEVNSVGARLEEMICTRHIDKEEPGRYKVRVLDGRAEIAELQREPFRALYEVVR